MSIVRRTISINKIQDKFLRQNNISLSKMIQKAINKQIDDYIFAKRSDRNLEEMDRGNYTEMDFDEFIKESQKW